MVPTLSPGSIFSALTGGDDTLNIRWLVATDPVMFEVLNRPIADTVLRQLILAKAIDALQLQLGHQTLFPFIIQPKVSSGTSEVDVPIGWIWDIHASLPKKWENLRLAKIKRMAGDNTTSGYSGVLRLIFTANVENSTTEVSIFYVDYEIESDLTYQMARLQVVGSTSGESTYINPSEAETVSGFIMFRTLNVDEAIVQAFYNLLEPSNDTSDANSDGLYDNPSVYELSDTPAGGPAVTGDYSFATVSHGTGLLTDSAWNSIPELDSDIQSWITAFNYPFDSSASRESSDSFPIAIPNGLFKEFNLTAPAGDEPTGDSSGTFYPVWISRIEKTGVGLLRFYFATYNVTDTAAGGNPSTTPVEFAILDLPSSGVENDIVAITPIDDLQLKTGSDAEFQQHFGRGHVVLSSLWDNVTTEIADFYSAFDVDVDGTKSFTLTATRISSFGLSRVPKYVPTIGQARALVGSTARRSSPIYPSYDNRYVCEQDQGLGNQVDLDALPSVTPNAAIDRYGYSGALTHRIVKLVVDATKVGNDPTFYDTQILPRLTALLGRAPAFGDFWFNGTRLMFHNGDAWQG